MWFGVLQLYLNIVGMGGKERGKRKEREQDIGSWDR